MWAVFAARGRSAPDCPTESKPGTPALLAAAQPSPWLRPAKAAPNYHPTTPTKQRGTARNAKGPRKREPKTRREAPDGEGL